MEFIKKIFRFKTGSYAQGTNFQKGDYINCETVYNARTNKGKTYEVSPEKIRQATGYKRINQNCMDSLKGQPIDKIKK